MRKRCLKANRHRVSGAFAEPGIDTGPAESPHHQLQLDAIRELRAPKYGLSFQHGDHCRLSGGLAAASHLPKFLPMLTTAAGTVRPAQGLILGAGVAGLQAIATARRMGAVVEAFDVRPAVKEQVKSLGAAFIEIPRAENLEDKSGYAKEVSAETLAQQQKLLHERAKLADFIIPPRKCGQTGPAPHHQRNGGRHEAGSVIIDLAAESGGNCEVTRADEIVRAHGVTILGPTNLPATLPWTPAGCSGATWPRSSRKSPTRTDSPWIGKTKFSRRPALRSTARPTRNGGGMIIGTLAMIYIFILAIFTGVEVISRVPTVLHTPLMSGANAIHGIVLIGGVILLGMAETTRPVRPGLHCGHSRHAKRRSADLSSPTGC